MSGAIAPKDWLRSAVDATAEVATGTLGYPANDQVEYSEEIPSGHRGAFIGLISQHNSVQLGVMSANGGCEKLARDLLGFEADEELAQEDVADAVGEIINIVTSANYGHHLGGAIGLGYVPCEGESPEDVLASTYEIEIAGTRVAAEASLAPMYDPKAERMKM